MSSSEKKPLDQPEGDDRRGLLPEADYPPPPPPQQDPPQYAPPTAELYAPPPTEKQQLQQRDQQEQQQQQQQQGQYFPPPPPGPAPHQEEQHHDSALPPSYEQGSYVAPASEKQAVPPVQPAAQQQQQGEFPASGSDQKQFPPPPPGPPPSQQQQQQQQPQPDPLRAHPVDAAAAQYSQPPQEHQQERHQEQQQQQQPQQQQTYTIPQYNPAAPVFAPPPAQPADQTAPEVPIPEASTYTPAATTATASGSTSEQVQPHKKHGWSERFSSLGIKAAAPINSLAHKLGSQSFLPETLDKECEKAASILRTFCKKGVYADPGTAGPPTSTDPKATETNEAIIDPTKNKPKSRVIVTIPPKVISKAVGLAIFTTLRAGFNVSGATGSGILIARLPDGSWGPPSGIQVHSVGGGFSIGLDIYDCVCVINSREALAAFTKTRVGLGTDLAVVAGPYGAGGAVEFGAAVENRPSRKQGGEKGEKESEAEQHQQSLKPDQHQGDKKRRSLSASGFKPVFSYVKSRGFYAGIQIDGTVVVERKEANGAFYGERVPVDKILEGRVPQQGPAGMWPTGARGLLETLRGAEAGALARDKSKEREGGEGKEKTSPPVAAAGSSTGTEHPPAYVDDGVQRPGVGDHKYR